MKIENFPYTDVPNLSSRDILFQTQQDKFLPYLQYPFTKEGFAEKIKERKTFPVNRKVLVDSILKHYENAGISDYPKEEIELLLKDNTFTVVTAHQPSLLTGPLYFIYKIISVINLAESLDSEYDDVKILPVFIVGSEDHDFDEINHLNLFSKKVVWENEEGGPVGRMSTDSLMPVLEEVYDILGNSENAEALKSIIGSSFKDVDNYNTGVLRLVHQLFIKYRLICLVADDKDLKAQFIPHIKKEIFEKPSQDLIQQTQEKLNKDLDVKSQAFAREINFFYLQPGRRDRIELNNGKYHVLDTDITFTKEELEEEIDQHPERFSPNVVMRPIYQETILPNLAYLGGGGEIAYWTERKTQFKTFGVSFPILVRRNSVLWLSKGDVKQLKQYGVEGKQIFDTDDDWIRRFLKENASASLEFSQEFDLFHKAYEMLEEKAEIVDKSLSQAVKGTHVKQFKIFEQLSGRLLRAEKDRNDKDVQKIKKLKDKLFPNFGLQERTDNFMSLYLKNGEEFFDMLKDYLDPFNPNFIIIYEE